MDKIYEQIEKEEVLRLANTVVRFILKYKSRRYGQYFEDMKTTTDYSELKKLLSSGGYNYDGDFEKYELIGAEVVGQSEYFQAKKEDCCGRCINWLDACIYDDDYKE